MVAPASGRALATPAWGTNEKARPALGNTIEQKFYRLADGRPARLRIEVDDDQGRLNPRADETSGAVIVTWDRDYRSPNHHASVPAEIEPATHEWKTGSHRGGIDAHKVVRYARIFRNDDVLYIGAISRNSYDGTLSIDDNPSKGARYDGVAIVTRRTLYVTHGEYLPDDADARRIAHDLTQEEVNRYNSWVVGDCYGYIVEVPAFPGAEVDHDPEVITSCWGYIGDDEISYMTSQAEGELDDGWTAIDHAQFKDICAWARDELVKVAAGIEYP
jgi:hypothetical protein